MALNNLVPGIWSVHVLLGLQWERLKVLVGQLKLPIAQLKPVLGLQVGGGAWEAGTQGRSCQEPQSLQLPQGLKSWALGD